MIIEIQVIIALVIGVFIGAFWRSTTTKKTKEERTVKLIIDDNEAVSHLNALHERIMLIDREIIKTNNKITGGQDGYKKESR